jgi:hypothetical protein
VSRICNGMTTALSGTELCLLTELCCAHFTQTMRGESTAKRTLPIRPAESMDACIALVIEDDESVQRAIQRLLRDSTNVREEAERC